MFGAIGIVISAWPAMPHWVLGGSGCGWVEDSCRLVSHHHRQRRRHHRRVDRDMNRIGFLREINKCEYSDKKFLADANPCSVALLVIVNEVEKEKYSWDNQMGGKLGRQSRGNES